MPSNTVRLEDMCSVIRSKNAGPYLITLDMIFKDRDAYESVAKDHLITRELIAERYRMPLDAVPIVEYIDDLNAVKVTYKRRVAAGSPGDSDCFGMNQEGPLMDIEFPSSVSGG